VEEAEEKMKEEHQQIINNINLHCKYIEGYIELIKKRLYFDKLSTNGNITFYRVTLPIILDLEEN
jgi:hypothetical protein